MLILLRVHASLGQLLLVKHNVVCSLTWLFSFQACDDEIETKLSEFRRKLAEGRSGHTSQNISFTPAPNKGLIETATQCLVTHLPFLLLSLNESVILSHI